MLKYYQALARFFHPLRQLFFLLAVAFVLVFLYLLLFAEPAISQQWALIVVWLTILNLLLWLIVQLFFKPLPEVLLGSTWSERLKIRVKRSVYYGLAILITGLLGAALLLGARTLSGIIQHVFF